MYSLGRAAKAVGRAKSTISNDLKTGKISATRNPDGSWTIDPAELHRVYPPVSNPNGSTNPKSNNHEPRAAGDRTGTELAGLRREVELLREQLDNRDDSIRDLRSRLDAESAERRTAQAQLTALLTDQRTAPTVPRRPWWPWKRRA